MSPNKNWNATDYYQGGYYEDDEESEALQLLAEQARRELQAEKQQQFNQAAEERAQAHRWQFKPKLDPEQLYYRVHGTVGIYYYPAANFPSWFRVPLRKLQSAYPGFVDFVVKETGRRIFLIDMKTNTFAKTLTIAQSDEEAIYLYHKINDLLKDASREDCIRFMQNFDRKLFGL